MDFYETGASAVRALLSRYRLMGPILEPCAGDGAIARPLMDAGYHVTTNDLDTERDAHTHYDAAKMIACAVDTVVSNPPFSLAYEILENFRPQNVDVVLLCRLSFLEPTKKRRLLVPPKAMIVLPRYSFTGDGRTDSVTCAWMLWGRFEPRIHIAGEEK